MIRTVLLASATRLSEAAFWARSFLGQSLAAMPAGLRPKLRITFDNHGDAMRGLPAIYNEAIAECPSSHHLVLVHDDVYLHDPFLAERVAEGLSASDVMGLAGSRNGDLTQPSWGLRFNRQLDPLGWQSGPHLVLSGAVSHSNFGVGAPRVQLSVYGRLSEPCDLLDGLFLACRPERLRDTGVRFDERFDFHLYDIDFCRSAREAGLRLSTWPILVTHGSGGNFGSPEWKAAARRYLDKWASRGASTNHTRDHFQ